MDEEQRRPPVPTTPPPPEQPDPYRRPEQQRRHLFGPGRRQTGREEEVERGGVAAFMLAALGALSLVVLFPLRVSPLVALALAGSGIWLGVRARRRGRRESRRAPGAVGAIVAGVLTCALALVLGATLLVFENEVRAYQDCVTGANTRVARSDCDRQLQDAVQRRTGLRP